MGRPFPISNPDIDAYLRKIQTRRNPVLAPMKNPDRNTRGILGLTRLLYSAPDFFTVLLPVRDGVTVSLKL